MTCLGPIPCRACGCPVHHRERGGAPGSFGQPRFPKALNHQLRFCLPAPSDPSRDCKGRIDLKQTRRRLTRLSVTSEMGQNGRQSAIGWRKRLVLTKSFLGNRDGLVEAAKFDQGKTDASKGPWKPGV